MEYFQVSVQFADVVLLCMFTIIARYCSDCASVVIGRCPQGCFATCMYESYVSSYYTTQNLPSLFV